MSYVLLALALLNLLACALVFAGLPLPGWILAILLAGSATCTLIVLNKQRKEVKQLAALSDLLSQTIAPEQKQFRTESAIEDKLRDLLAERRMLFEKSPSTICSIRPDGTLVAVSNASRRMFGYDPAELVGRKVTDFIVSSMDKGGLTEMLSAQSGGSSFENQLNHKSGKTKDLLWSVYWSQSEQAFSCIVHDITDRKEMERTLVRNEEKLRLIMQNAPAAILVLSSDGRIVSSNQYGERLFGNEKDQLCGQMFSNLVRGGDDLQSKISAVQAYSGRRLLEVADELVPADLHIGYYEDTTGVNPLVIVFDATEVQRLENLKKEFLNTVSHDLRTPLAAVSIFLQSLGNNAYEGRSDALQSNLINAQHSLNRVLSLVTSLLKLEKMDSSELEFTKTVFSIKTAVTSAVRITTGVASAKDICIDTTEPEEELSVIADFERILDVILNLLSNAIKYSPPDSMILVGFRRTGNNAEIFVRDNGRGIPSDKLAVIFDRFKQVERSDNEKGFGLGLAICKSIVEQHGGTISAHSTAEETTFTFLIPLAEIRQESVSNAVGN